MNQQFGEVHELIDNERKKREESENNFVQNLEEIMSKVKTEFGKEKKQREEFEENFNINIDSLEQKYNILKEQISKFTKKIEKDKKKKEKSKKKKKEK